MTIQRWWWELVVIAFEPWAALAEGRGSEIGGWGCIIAGRFSWDNIRVGIGYGRKKRVREHKLRVLKRKSKVERTHDSLRV